jgi:hypothetical protein
MPLIEYKAKRFKPATLEMIEKANTIIEEYMDAGYVLTVRQLYYQFVGRGIFPEDRRWRKTESGKWVKDPDGTKNAEPNYKWLGGILNDARMAGLVDWEAIEDRGRSLHKQATWDDPREIISACANQFKIDMWDRQQYRPEIWVEKEALAGVIEPMADKLRVPCFACKGYTSLSAMWEAGHIRLMTHLDMELKPVIIHLGDHDPSGIDMSRDIKDRLALFADAEIHVERIALNMDQVRQYDPPPDPAKVTDSRYIKYQELYGDESWELDALEPAVMDKLITDAVEFYIDWDFWDEDLEREKEHLKKLGKLSDQWDSLELD